MGSREKYEVPDWVVDDYNSRVSEEDRLPLRGGSTITNSNTNNYSCSNTNTRKSSHSNTKSTPSQHSNDFSWLPLIILFVSVILVVKFPIIAFIIIVLGFLSWVYS